MQSAVQTVKAQVSLLHVLSHNIEQYWDHVYTSLKHALDPNKEMNADAFESCA